MTRGDGAGGRSRPFCCVSKEHSSKGACRFWRSCCRGSCCSASPSATPFKLPIDEVALHVAAGSAQHRRAPRPCWRSRCWCSTTSWSRPTCGGTFFFGKTTIIIYWFLEMFFLGGTRLAYRYFRYTRTRNQARSGEARTDAADRACGRCRGAAARHRERRGEAHLAGRHPVAVAGRSRPVDPGCSRARRHRRSRRRGRGFLHAATPDRARDHDAVGV